MPREKENFRDTLCSLQERFPGRETISRAEAAQVLGVAPNTMISRTNIKAGFPIKRLGRRWVVPVVGLARWLS